MPDQHGKEKTEAATVTTLHAYADDREDQVDPGSRGVTGQNGTADEASYEDGGHHDHAVYGETPAATGHQDPAGAHTGSGPGTQEDRSSGPRNGSNASGDGELVDPESPARAEAGRVPRGAPPA